MRIIIHPKGIGFPVRENHEITLDTFKIDEIDIDHMDDSTLKKFTNTCFRWTGFRLFDRFGKDVYLNTADTLLRMMMYSKYQANYARQNGVVLGTVRTIMPPIPFMDSAWQAYKHVKRDGLEAFTTFEGVRKFQMYQDIPLIGKEIHWRFGAGHDWAFNSLGKWEKENNKESKQPGLQFFRRDYDNWLTAREFGDTAIRHIKRDIENAGLKLPEPPDNVSLKINGEMQFISKKHQKTFTEYRNEEMAKRLKQKENWIDTKSRKAVKGDEEAKKELKKLLKEMSDIANEISKRKVRREIA